MTQDGALPGDFLAKFWQKNPRFMQGGLKAVAPELSGDELAWLAIQDDVEARLVHTEIVGGKTGYRIENGPFDESRLGALPERDWTLLVQDVEKHLPDFREHFAPFRCIPDWRIDDLMISFAAPGGSVGPHRDNYDVFLVQGQGNREWRLADAAGTRVDDTASGLSLLHPFTASVTYDASAGDILYLPPGVPHWGIAKDFCTTYSIGMRAPSRAELRAGAARVFDTDDVPVPDDEQHFYTDSDLKAEECEPGMIHAATIRRVRSQGLLDTKFDDQQIATVFGSVVTDPKAWLMPEPIEELPRRMQVHGMARLAWFDDGSSRLAFANGAAREIGLEDCRFVSTLCRNRLSGRVIDISGLAEPPGDDLLEWLRLESVFDAEACPE